ncbi:RSC chromatin remodeling complex ATPase component [Malassezia cuniculi]|uniref:RSC chromatin remodeling complex ATPase component n=1 Tax=Malassezia cuniculi TaxID=948313 RepID=A0AAF0J4R1_9BASI|nr:RSC chromatin remodeling complex ATPase component [Malassezia cuniculi]
MVIVQRPRETGQGARAHGALEYADAYRSICKAARQRTLGRGDEGTPTAPGGAAVLLAVAPDVDALAATRVLTQLLAADEVPYRISPVNGYRCLQQILEEDVSGHLELHTLVFVNLGSIISLPGAIPLPPHCTLHVLDSHRPWNLDNLFATSQLSERIWIWDDGEIQRLENEKEAYEMLEFDVESDTDDEDGSDGEGAHAYDSDVDRQSGGSQQDTPRKKRRGLDSAARQEYRRIIARYYARGTWSGMSVAQMAYMLSVSLGRSDNDALWYGIIGVTAQLLANEVHLGTYEGYSDALASDVVAMNTPNKVQDKLPVADMNVHGADDSAIRVIPEELRFTLYRHWSLEMSMYHTGYVAAKLGIWREKGMSRLRGLLAKMGLSLNNCRQTYEQMDLDLRKSLVERMETIAPEYGLTDIVFRSFTRSFGFRSMPLSASDAVEGVSALLQAAHGVRIEIDGPHIMRTDSSYANSRGASSTTGFGTDGMPERGMGSYGTQTLWSLGDSGVSTPEDSTRAIWIQNFFEAFRALDAHKAASVALLRSSLQLAKALHRAVVAQGVALIAKQSIKTLRSFRLSILHDSAPALFVQPETLMRLGLWLIDALRDIVAVQHSRREEARRERRRSKGADPELEEHRALQGLPFVLAALDAPRDMYVVVGVVGAVDYGDVTHNNFGLAFQAAASRSGARMRNDRFDTAVVETPRAPPVSAAGASSLLSQLPPQAQQQLAGMTKERLQQIVMRMHQLKAEGQTEQSNPEYATLMQTLKAFQYVQQLRMQQVAAVQASASSAGPNQSAPTPPNMTSLSNEQLAALQSQVSAAKQLARNQPLAAQLQKAALDGRDAATATSVANKVADAAIESHAAAVASQAAEGKRGESTRPDPSSAVYPYNAYVHPFTLLNKPTSKGSDIATLQQRLLIPSLLPAGIDARLLLEERDRFVRARMQQRIRELESMASTMAQVPMRTPKSLSEQIAGLDGHGADNAKVRALIELKALHLVDRQREVREQIVASMGLATSIGLDRSAFRRVRKQTLRDARVTEQLERKQRTERERKAKQRHTDYLSMICMHGKDLIAAQNKAADQARRIGRMVLKLHSDVEREEQKRIERVAKERLNALKADDEEAYLKLIDTAKDTRITHLLQQTDAYLDSLAQAVQAQQNDDVFADTLSGDKSRISVGGEAVDETTFGASREDEPDETGKVDYYSVAHRITERIDEQPSILVGGTLKEYQMKGLQWMVSLYNNRLNGILADEMGLGKTIQTISLITFLIESKKQNGPYLVIVPLSTLTNWVNEFNKWAPSVTTLVYKGTPSVRKQLAGQLKMGTFQVLLTTYEYIIKEKNLLGKIKWTHMIIDEGHRMKNTQSKLTITLTQSYSSRYRLLLTGTPLQNNLPELWALLNFVLPKIFNSIKSFDEWFNTPFVNTGQGDNSMQLNEEEALLIIKRLHKVLRPFLLRRLKKDVEAELPDKVERVIKCRMSALQSKLYQQMKKHKVIFSDTGSGDRATKPQGIRGLQNAIMQLRKICNHPYVFEQVEASINPTKENGPDLYRVAGKFELLDRILPKLFATGHRVLIFFQMTAIMDIMEDFLRFRGIKYLRLDGSTKPDDRSMLLRQFNDPDSEYYVFILSTRAGGLGLNLQSADTVIIYDSDWNPHQDLQAQDRAHRIGQKVEVRILRLVTEKSVEETILARAQSKLEINGKVIQAGKFDNQATADERESLLRAMLEADNEEEEEEERGELNDDELNEMLARSEDEVIKFQEVDRERRADDEAEWRALGNTGPMPERLMQEHELPAMYKRDFEAELSAAQSEQSLTRRRNVVHYDDGLTEDQFLRALEEEEDLNEVVERKRERAEKRRLRQAAAESGADTHESATDEQAAAAEASDDTRKRKIDTSESETSKRRRVDGEREAVREALLPIYNAVKDAEDESGRPHSELFLEIPKKSEYPDYHVLIKRPIALKQIKRRIDTRAYKSVEAARDDFYLMFENARTYNQEGSLVWLDAEALQAVFDSKYAELQNDIGHGSGAGHEAKVEQMPISNDANDEADDVEEDMYGDEDDHDSDGDDYADSDDGDDDIPVARKKGMKIKLSVEQQGFFGVSQQTSTGTTTPSNQVTQIAQTPAIESGNPFDKVNIPSEARQQHIVGIAGEKVGDDRTKVLLALDGTEAGDKAFNYVIENKTIPKDSHIFLVTVLPANVLSGPWVSGPLSIDTKKQNELLRQLRQQAVERMQPYKAKLKERGFAVTLHVLHGDARASLLKVISYHHADMVVLGKRNRSWKKALSGGAITSYIVSHSPVPVLVIK